MGRQETLPVINSLQQCRQRDLEYARHAKALERLTELMAAQGAFEEEEQRHQMVLRRIEEGLRADGEESESVRQPPATRKPAPVRPTARGAAGSPPPFKARQGEKSYESYSAFLKGNLIPGTSRRLLGQRRELPQSPVNVSTRLYPEPQYDSPEARRVNILETARRLRQEIAQDEAPAKPIRKLTPADVERVTQKLHDADLNRRQERARRELEKLDEPQEKSSKLQLTKQAELDMNKRLHDEWLRRKKQGERELQQEAEQSMWRPPPEGGEQVEEIVRRNYYGPMEKIKESARAENLRRSRPLHVRLAEAEHQQGSPTSPVPPSRRGREEKQAKGFKAALRQTEGKKLGRAEVEASADRLCVAEQAKRAEKHSALMQKYLSR